MLTRYMTRKILVVVVILTWTCSPTLAQFGIGPNSDLKSLRIVGKHRPVGELWARTDLYFGTAKPDGTVVTDEQFKLFLDQVVTPRFPDGLTLLTGFGQFRDSSGTILQERSMLLILLYPPPTHDSSKKIEEIRAIYKQTFQQESVLRVDTAGLVSF
jgi:hypothetical protein